MSEWISVKERIPSSEIDFKNSRYIVFGKKVCGNCNDKTHVFECRFRRRAKDWEWGEYDCPVEVYYWMPLPEPPSS